MAAWAGVRAFVSYFIICLVIQCALTNFINQDQTLVIKDHSNSVYVNQVYSFTVLSNFNGFKSLEYLNASSRAIEPERVSDIIQSSKYSVPTKFVLLALISCGDIQSNPGPRADIRKNKRKYIFKFPCTVCGQGVRGRPIPCVCGQLTHSTCIKNLTNDLYDELKSNNEEIIYKCVFCVNNNNKLRRNQNHNNGSEIVKGAWASSQHVTTENGASQQRQQGATQGGKATSSKALCATLAAVVFGQDFIPVRQPQRQLVNQGFGGQVNQGGFGNQVNQGFGGQQQPAPILRQQQQVINQQQIVAQQQTDILEDIRDGPFWDGSYYFRYGTADGTVREEGARLLQDGTIQVTGSYGYRAPNGEVFEMEYIADTQGYRAFPKGTRADFIPPQRAVAPQGLPPFQQQNFIDGNNFIQAQPQQRPQPRPQPRPRPTQAFNQPGNNFVRPGNNINAVNGIRPTPSFQGNSQGFGGGLPFGQVNRNGQDINLSGASSDDTFVAVELPQN